MSKTYQVTEEIKWNPDDILNQVSSIKELLTYEFNEENDNIERNKRILELMFIKISSIEKVLKTKGVL